MPSASRITGRDRLPLPLAVAALLLLAAACGHGPSDKPGKAGRETVPPEGPVVLVLGTAQDGGLPHAGCSCAHCQRAGDDPAFRRGIASLGIVFPREGIRYLVDATPDVRPQLIALRRASPVSSPAAGRNPVDGVLLTHAHIGHYLGLAFFGYESIHTSGLPVLCTPAMGRFLESNGPWDQLVRLGNIAVREIEHEQAVALHSRLRVTPIRVPHRDEYADTVAWLLEGPDRSLLYVPDTDRWDTWQPSLTERLEGVDVAVLDGTFYSPDELPGRDLSTVAHPLMVTTMDLLESRVGSGELEVYFTHLNHSNLALDPDGDPARTIRQRGFHIASDGLEIPL